MVRRRFLRRVVLLVFSLSLVLVGVRLAHADSARVEIGTRASVRRLLVEGDFDAARSVADRLRISEDPSGRAALDELVLVLDAWSTRLRPPPPSESSPGEDVTNPTAESGWEPSLSVARELLIWGSYAEAALRLDALMAKAPDVSHACRASELRALAREALAQNVRHEEATARSASSPTVRKAQPHTNDPPANGRWYGWQTLIVDATALTLAPFAPTGGVAMFALAPASVHIAHERWLAGLASVGLRVGCPIAGGLTGAVLLHDGSVGGLTGAVAGVSAGLITAVALDAAILGRERPKRVPETVSVLRAVHPSGGWREGGVDVGLQGVF